MLWPSRRRRAGSLLGRLAFSGRGVRMAPHGTGSPRPPQHHRRVEVVRRWPHGTGSPRPATPPPNKPTEPPLSGVRRSFTPSSSRASAVVSGGRCVSVASCGGPLDELGVVADRVARAKIGCPPCRRADRRPARQRRQPRGRWPRPMPVADQEVRGGSIATAAASAARCRASRPGTPITKSACTRPPPAGRACRAAGAGRRRGRGRTARTPAGPRAPGCAGRARRRTATG